MENTRQHDTNTTQTITVTPDSGDKDGDEGSGRSPEPPLTRTAYRALDLWYRSLAYPEWNPIDFEHTPGMSPPMSSSQSSFDNFTSMGTRGTRTPSSLQSSFSSWPSTPGPPDDGNTAVNPQDKLFSISPEDLAKLMESGDWEQLQALGGLDGIARALQTDCAAGLSSKDASLPNLPCTHAERRRIFGENRLPDKQVKTIWQHTLEAVKEPTVIVLLTVDLFIILLGVLHWTWQPNGAPKQNNLEWLDAVFAILAISVVISANVYLAYRTDTGFMLLSKKKEDRLIKVIRSGKRTAISVYDLMVGDVLTLEQGDLVPADGILISGCHIQCDQSCVTGESELVDKVGAYKASEFQHSHLNAGTFDPFIISGSKILGPGFGRCLVTCVGINSRDGRLRIGLTERTEETPLQKRLAVLLKMITNMAFVVAFLLLVSLLIKSRFASELSTQSVDLLQRILDILGLVSTVVFVAIPEGLVLAVYVALYLANAGMLRDNSFVRRLASCETMGNATAICCDKTGTLTLNEMRVTVGIIGTTGRFVEEGPQSVNGTYNPISFTDNPNKDDGNTMASRPTDGDQLSSVVCPQICDLLAKSAAINSTVDDGYKDDLPTYLGSTTEIALIRIARKRFGLKSPLVQEREKVEVVDVFPFDSSMKCMATVTKHSENSYRMYVKGAPEMLLQKSDRTIEDPQQPIDSPMSEEQFNLFSNVIADYASASLRTLGLAYRDFPIWPPAELVESEISAGIKKFERIFRHLTFLGIFGIQDPLRPDVKEAVLRAQGAGVLVRMVTGDNINTARAVATACGILAKDDQDGAVLEGPEFRALSADERRARLPRLRVLARSSPDDKKLIVTALKELGETVAVTGDGTNDGPALRAADVGFSMGMSGTEVAKDASSIVLLDDNFASIIKAIEWGRTVVESIRRFLQFQLTANLTSVFLTVVSSLSSPSQRPILNPVQLLWLNLIMDPFGAVALAIHRPDPTILNRPPEKQTQGLLSFAIYKMIAGQACYQLLACLYLNLGYSTLHPDSADSFTTVFFNSYIWMQFFNLFNCRRIDNSWNIFRGILKDKWFCLIAALIVLIQALIISFGGDLLEVRRLNGSEWALSLALGFLTIPTGIAIRSLNQDYLQRLQNGSVTVLRLVTPDFLADRGVRDGLPLWNGRAEPDIYTRTWNLGPVQKARRWIGSLRDLEPANTEAIPNEQTCLLQREQT